MPPKAKNQLTLTSLFSKDVKVPPVGVKETETKTKTVTEPVTETVTETKTAEDKEVAAFYASLTPNEKKAHDIAITFLRTSYDVRRTHGFNRWLTTQKTAV